MKEKSAVLSLGMIMAFRMLGLFMILPVFSAYIHHSSEATPLLIGLALGIYGLTQAVLQIPFGYWSDRIGRKPVITIGLILFALGSVVAALSHHIGGIILGRALQGAGAIGSTVLALVADLTRDQHRNKAMAFVGLTIGLSFMVAMILGPLVNAAYQLSGIFWLSAIFALLGIGLLFTTVPKAPRPYVDEAVEPSPRGFRHVLKDRQLLHLDLSIGIQHAIFTAIFIAIPILLTHDLGLSAEKQIWLYVGVLVLAFFCMIPFIIIGEKKRHMKAIFLGAISVILLCQILMLCFPENALPLSLSLFLFFTAFTTLESCLPSMVSKVAPILRKGSAMGIYSSCQFLGIFLGGSIGGLVFSHFQFTGLFLFSSFLATIWLLLSLKMKEPPYLSTIIVNLTECPNTLQQDLKQKNGVHEIAWQPAEQLLYVKIDKTKTTEQQLRKAIEQGSLGHAH